MFSFFSSNVLDWLLRASPKQTVSVSVMMLTLNYVTVMAMTLAFSHRCVNTTTIHLGSGQRKTWKNPCHQEICFAVSGTETCIHLDMFPQTTLTNKIGLIIIMHANLFAFQRLFFGTDGLPALGKHVSVQLRKNCNIRTQLIGMHRNAQG